MAELRIRICDHNENGVYKIFTNAGIYYLCPVCIRDLIGYLIDSADLFTQDYISYRIEDIIDEVDTRLSERLTTYREDGEICNGII